MRYSTKRYGRQEPRRQVTLVLAIIAIIVLLGALQWLRNRSEPIQTQAEVAVISGQIAVTRSDSGTRETIPAGQIVTVRRGDEVETSPDGMAKLTFGQEQTTEMAPGTRLTLLEHYQSAVSRSQVTILALQDGELLTRIPHVLFQGSRFVIETRIATVEAKGTVFHTSVLDPQRIDVRVQEGIVQLGMSDQAVSIEAGQRVVAELGQTLAVTSWDPALAPTATSVPTATGPAARPTYTEQQKTLFPAVETPTRPGDDLIRYTVQPGDTLSSIGREHGLSWKVIFEANKQLLSSPDALRAGQELIIPQP